jgi:hypothetical protein
LGVIAKTFPFSGNYEIAFISTTGNYQRVLIREKAWFDLHVKALKLLGGKEINGAKTGQREQFRGKAINQVRNES